MTLYADFSVKGAKWLLNDFDKDDATLLEGRFGLPKMLAEIISARGIELSQVDSFLNPRVKDTLPNPFHLIDMDKAVDCLIDAIHNNFIIAIFADYDVDGATSAALLRRYFDVIGASSIIYVPDRIDEGYGPTKEAFAKLSVGGAGVCITVDCGVNAHEALSGANKMGLPVVVIDHHIGTEVLPEAVAVVNPNRLDETSEYTNLAAVGVTFLFVVALNKKLRDIGFFLNILEQNLIDYLDLVALGTVCDVVSLTGLNRSFVSSGLKVMAKSKNLGIKALSDVAGLRNKPEAYHLGFVLGPRINAGGRVGESFLGARLLSTNDVDESRDIAERLDYYNSQRRDLEKVTLQDAMLQISSEPDNILIVRGKDWHFGVIGIVASRLKERFGLPVIVISVVEGIGKASARSVEGVDLGNAILDAKAQGILIEGGGHAMAAGFSVTEQKIPVLCDFLSKRFGEFLKKRDVILKLDGVLALNMVNIATWRALNLIAPFGVGNHEPRFIIEDVIIHKVKIVASEHISCNIINHIYGSECKAIAFRAVDTPLGEALLTSSDLKITLAVKLTLNRWRGMENVELIIDDAVL